MGAAVAFRSREPAASPRPQAGGPAPWVGFAHLLVVYVVWGSTYLAIQVAVQAGIPPFTLVAGRTLLAGLVLLRQRAATVITILGVRDYNIAVIPGDGIGAEVVPEAIACLDAIADRDGGFRCRYQTFDWGSERYLRDGAMMPADALPTLERGGFHALLVGPVGDSRVPDHVTLWGPPLPIRQSFDQYVNLRPIRLLEGVPGPLAGTGPGQIDMVCVRENTEAEAARRLEAAIEQVLAAGRVRTGDLGGKATTREMGEAIRAALVQPASR